MAWFTRSRLFAAAIEAPPRRRMVRAVGAATAISLLVALTQGTATASADTYPPDDSGLATSAPTDATGLAAHQALEIGEPVEVEGSQTATTTEYRNPDGTTTIAVTQEPTRTKQDGQWIDIDPTLQPSDGVLAPMASEAGVQISDGVGDGAAHGEPLAEVTKGKNSLALNWPANLPQAVVDGSTATFDTGSKDVRVSATGDGFAVHVVLDQPPATAPVYRLPVAATGVRLVKTDSGEFRAEDANGKAVFWIAPPVMWDHTQDDLEAGPEHTTPVQADLAEDADGKQTLELRPPMSVLTDPATVYPVTVDPDVFSDATVYQDTYVTSSDPNRGFPSSTYLRVGYDSTSKVNRAYMQFNIPAHVGTVTHADLRVYQYDSDSCTPSNLYAYRSTQQWRNVDTTGTGPMAGVWYNANSAGNHVQPVLDKTATYSNSPHAFTHGLSGCPAPYAANDYDTVDVTNMVDGWVTGKIPNYGLGLRAATETSDAAYKAICSANVNTSTSATSCYDGTNPPTSSLPRFTLPRVPTLLVTYSATPTAVTPAANEQVDSLTPTLSGAIAGTVAGAEFDIVDVLTGTALLDATDNAGAADPDALGRYMLEVPDDLLLPGHMYKWRMRATTTSDWSAYQWFHTWPQIAQDDEQISDDSGSKPCTTGDGRAVFDTLTPKLQASIQDLDTTGGPESAAYDLELFGLGSTVPIITATSAAFTEGTFGSWTVPAGLLVPGQAYFWHARPAGQAAVAWSDDCEFLINKDGVPMPVPLTYVDPADGSSHAEEPTQGDDTGLLYPSSTDGCATGCDRQTHTIPDGVDPADLDPDGVQPFATSGSAPHWPAECKDVTKPYWHVVNRFAMCTAAVNIVSSPIGVAKGTLYTRAYADGNSWVISQENYFPWKYSTGAEAVPLSRWITYTCTRCAGSGQQYLSETDTALGADFKGTRRISLSLNAKELRSITDTAFQTGWLNGAGTATSDPIQLHHFRCDWIVPRAGCVITGTSTIPVYKVSGKYVTVRDHIQAALQSGLPGSPARGPLTRISTYSATGSGATALARQTANRQKACRYGVPARPTILGVKYSCDEYPFAASNQGAASGGSARTFNYICHWPTNDAGTPVWNGTLSSSGWSRCFVVDSENIGEGPKRAGFLNGQHVLDGERFYVAA